MHFEVLVPKITHEYPISWVTFLACLAGGSAWAPADAFVVAQ